MPNWLPNSNQRASENFSQESSSLAFVLDASLGDPGRSPRKTPQPGGRSLFISKKTDVRRLAKETREIEFFSGLSSLPCWKPLRMVGGRGCERIWLEFVWTCGACVEDRWSGERGSLHVEWIPLIFWFVSFIGRDVGVDQA